jgi:hypothetical protein
MEDLIVLNNKISSVPGTHTLCITDELMQKIKNFSKSYAIYSDEGALSYLLHKALRVEEGYTVKLSNK